MVALLRRWFGHTHPPTPQTHWDFNTGVNCPQEAKEQKPVSRHHFCSLCWISRGAESGAHAPHRGGSGGLRGCPPPPTLSGPLLVTICSPWKIVTKSSYHGPPAIGKAKFSAHAHRARARARARAREKPAVFSVKLYAWANTSFAPLSQLNDACHSEPSTVNSQKLKDTSARVCVCVCLSVCLPAYLAA